MPRSQSKPESENLDTDSIDFGWDERFSPQLGSSRPPPPRKLATTSESTIQPIEITEESGAHALAADLPPPRETMVTLEDEDPLRYDIACGKPRDATRDSMPTIPESDPLRYDIEDPAPVSAALNQAARSGRGG